MMNVKSVMFRLCVIMLLGFPILFFSACNKDDVDHAEGDVTFEITDAPTDNPEVKAVFVTITDVKVEGKSFPGFKGPKTVNLLALQNGQTEILGTGRMAARAYGNVTLELDLEKDQEGNSPGCYVLTQENVKKQITSSGQSTLRAVYNRSLSIGEATNQFVVDFDLRKAIASRATAGGTAYTFADLSKSIRVVNKMSSGTVKGNFSQSHNDYLIIAYAYKRGDFNKEAETQGEVLFQNAINSSLVSKTTSGGDFVLAYLEEGNYEVHFARYKKNSGTGNFELEGMLDVDAGTSASLNNLSVSAGANINLSLAIKGIIFI
jgi:hypothetical protein